MDIPGLGTVVKDDDLDDAYLSGPISARVLNGVECEFVVRGYDGDETPDDFHRAIGRFLDLDPAVLALARPAVYEYYLEVKRELGDELDVAIASPDSVLDHVELGNRPEVVRHDDERIYILLESECDWEPEHGLQFVFRDGAEITRVSAYDGDPTDD